MTTDELSAEILRLRDRYGFTEPEIRTELLPHGPMKVLVAKVLRSNPPRVATEGRG